jgi:hypothetical protein
VTELWSVETLARVDVARRRIRGLRQVATQMFPRAVASNGEHGDWPITGWAMLARMGGTADSIVALIPQRRATDAAVLSRTLLESVITFAWIGIDPPAHAPAWLRWDRRQRLKADNDVTQSGASALLDAQARQDFERIVATGPAMPEDISQRATQVDTYWGPRLAAVDEDPASSGSTRGLYRYIFRRDSQHAHAAVASLEPLILGTPPGPFHVVAVEADPGTTNAFTMTPVLYALALIFAESMFGITGLQRAADDVFAGIPESAPDARDHGQP